MRAKARLPGDGANAGRSSAGPEVFPALLPGVPRAGSWKHRVWERLALSTKDSPWIPGMGLGGPGGHPILSAVLCVEVHVTREGIRSFLKRSVTPPFTPEV